MVGVLLLGGETLLPDGTCGGVGFIIVSMARSEFEMPLESIHGKLGKKSKLIFRRKTARNANRHALYDCVQEIYVIERPRDRKKNPPQGAELASINRFREA